MGYIKNKYRALLEQIDNKYNYNIPDNWDDFVNKFAEKHHNLIIKKAKGKCICTNCKHEFITKKNAKEYEKCPNCKNIYQVKLNNLKNYIFEDVAVLVNKVDSQLVLRIFEIQSIYNNKNSYYSFYVSSVEYARILPFLDNATFVNDRTSRNTGPINIYHISNPGKWRLYTRYHKLNKTGYVYTDNLKEILQDTDYKYSMIWELAKNIKYLDIENILRIAGNSNSIEILTKAKLYNLAIEAHHFYESGNFDRQFGISKTFYPFMKKCNITYQQLKILQILKEPNIQKIRYLEKYPSDRLKKIDSYIGINRFIKYAKLHRGKIDIYLYKDYLKFANLLGYDLKNNKYAFPRNLRKEHDELAKQYKIHNTEIINEAIHKRYENLSKNIFKNKKFIILPAPTIESLEDESTQQNNCVRTYAEDYSTQKCDIYFMRDINNQNNSLVTVEVQNNRIVQSKTKYNNVPNKTQQKFLNRWEQKILQKVA